MKDIAFAVNDAISTFEEAIANGASSVMEPVVGDFNGACFVKATIAAFGDTVHSFTERNAVDGWLLPGFKPMERTLSVKPIGLTAVDHVAICVEALTLEHWVDYYHRSLASCSPITKISPPNTR